MRKRTLYSLLVTLALIVALIAAVWLRKHAPPEVARLLPESDAIVYFNLRPLRAATHFDRTPHLPVHARNGHPRRGVRHPSTGHRQRDQRRQDLHLRHL